MSQSKIRESELDIKMDLLERHKDEVIDYIKSKLNNFAKSDLKTLFNSY